MMITMIRKLCKNRNKVLETKDFIDDLSIHTLLSDEEKDEIYSYIMEN